MNKYIWEQRPLYHSGLSHPNLLIQRVLSHRAPGGEIFIDPKRPDIFTLFDDWEVAARLILDYIAAKDKIVIYGDYDADGVTATATLCRSISRLGGDVSYYIPHRTKEGYGLNVNAIDEIYAEFAAPDMESPRRVLLITVDTGISGFNEVAYCRSLGIDIIITDHHEIPENKPPANAIMNPKSLVNLDLHSLCGAGMAWVLMQGVLEMSDKTGGDGHPHLLPDYFDDIIELPAIGTVGDMSELSGYNRSLVRQGLSNLKSTKIKGLSSLLKLMGIETGQINSETIGFKIAPSINAAGRLDSARDAIELLLTDDESEADELAARIIEANTQRQAITARSAQEAVELFHLNNWSDKPVAVIYNPDWHAGIIGLVASHIVRREYKPAIIIGGLDENGIAKGSCRSIEGFNIFDIVFANSNYLGHFGGHSLAAGFSIHADNIDDFISGCIESADHFWADTVIPNILYYDDMIALRELDIQDVKELHRVMEPYGRGSPKPVFRDTARLLSQKKIGKNNEHLRLEFRLIDDDSSKITAIAFGMGWLFPIPNKPLDILYTPSVNIWNNTESLQVELLDVRVLDSGS